jgi:hypothetical protein
VADASEVKRPKVGSGVPGISIFSGVFVGLTGEVLAIYCLFRGESMPMSVCLVASALAFGLIANAVWRE